MDVDNDPTAILYETKVVSRKHAELIYNNGTFFSSFPSAAQFAKTRCKKAIFTSATTAATQARSSTATASALPASPVSP